MCIDLARQYPEVVGCQSRSLALQYDFFDFDLLTTRFNGIFANAAFSMSPAAMVVRVLAERIWMRVAEVQTSG